MLSKTSSSSYNGSINFYKDQLKCYTNVKLASSTFRGAPSPSSASTSAPTTTTRRSFWHNPALCVSRCVIHQECI